jgi:hypothetical protein
MPGKSKRKKMRYASNNQNKMGQTPASTAQSTVAGTPVANKPQSAPVKSFTAGGKTAAAQLNPEQFKHVGSELRVVGILSAIIIVVIVALFFILR